MVVNVCGLMTDGGFGQETRYVLASMVCDSWLALFRKMNVAFDDSGRDWSFDLDLRDLEPDLVKGQSFLDGTLHLPVG
jgi:hypothetical protein